MNKICTLAFFISFVLIFQSCSRFPILANTELKPGSTIKRKKLVLYRDIKMEVYENEKRPSKPYELIAQVTVTGNHLCTKKGLIYAMRKEAAFYKADGIILTGKRYVKRTGPDGSAELFTIVGLAASIATESDLNPDVSESYQEFDVMELEGIVFRYKN